MPLKTCSEARKRRPLFVLRGYVFRMREAIIGVRVEGNDGGDRRW